ncbi:hypothetical protein B0O99DRAFT_691812 [Bisporella sp. PMI_857]|nr:hypothetical protein B0O99DRAFT_691812 [Bisporella sp. PMI_857]
MAEILGAVASGITVVGVAGKLGDRFIRLKRLLNEVQDVPEMIASLVGDIEILEPLLTEMEKDFDDTMATGTATRSAQLALWYCRKAMVDLDALLEELSVDLKSPHKLRRGKAKFRVVLRKDVLNRFTDQLSKALRFLSLAQQVYMPELIVRHLRSVNATGQRQLEEPSPETTEREDNTTTNIIHSHPTTRNTVARTKTSSFARWGFGAFGELAWQYTQYDSEFNETNFNFNARLQFLQAFVWKAWDIQVSKATSGWNFNLKPYNIVSENSLVVTYAQKGNINGLRELFYNKQASIYDRDPDGSSLLWLAALGGSPDLMKFLITWGLDINEECDLVGETPVHCLFLALTFLPDFKSAQDLLILYNAYNMDGSLFASMVHNPNFFTRFGRVVISSTEIFKEIQPLLWPRHYGLLIIDRLNYFEFDVSKYFGRSYPKAQAFRYILREDGVLREEDVVELQRQGINLLNLVAYCRSCWSMNIEGSLGWRKLCREIILITPDLSYNQATVQLLPQSLFQSLSGTPLVLVMLGSRWLYCSVTRLIRSLKLRLRLWLEDLHACGVDLQKYGHAEKEKFTANGLFGNRWFGNRLSIESQRDPNWVMACSNVKVKLIDFDVGLRPEDWVFHWDMDAERYAHQFWGLIENPQIQIPGSWVDDDESIYCSSIDEYDSDDGEYDSDDGECDSDDEELGTA